MKPAILIAVLLFCIGVWVDGKADIVATWTPPTERTDGTAFDMATEAQSQPVTCTGPGTLLFTLPNNVAAWTPPAGTFPVGDWTCTIAVIGVDGTRSAESNPTTFTIAPSVTAPPRAIFDFSVN